MPAETKSFGEAYFGKGSVYSRFLDTEAAANRLVHWYEGLFRMLDRRYADAYPLAGPILEVGAGHGAVLRILRLRGLRPVGADISTFILETQRALDPLAPLVSADTCGLPFMTGAFRTVVTFEMLEHIPEPGHALMELHRSLAPGGVLVATTPNPRADRLPSYDSSADPTHVSVRPPSWWVDALLGAGFQTVRVTTYLQIPFLWRRVPFARRVVELPAFGPTSLLLARRS